MTTEEVHCLHWFCVKMH